MGILIIRKAFKPSNTLASCGVEKRFILFQYLVLKDTFLMKGQKSVESVSKPVILREATID
jgi:hypothetical protein